MARGYVYEDDGTGWRQMLASDLPNSGVTATTYGDATHVAQVTVNAQGLVTSASSVAITGGGGSGTVTSVASADSSVTVTNPTTTPDLAVAKAPKLSTARNIDGQAFDGTAAITVIAPGTHAATSKATPVDADELPLVDSAASNVLKKLTWANLKATGKAYYDTVYAPIGGSGGGGGAAFVATDAIWDTKGDAVYGTGSDAAAKVAAGTNGQVLVYDSAQTPGVKVAYPPGFELDYVERTTSVTVTSVADGTSGGTAVITGNAVTYDGSTRICIEFYAPAASITPTAVARQINFNLYDGTTDLGRLALFDGPVGNVLSRAPIFVRRFLTPSNASHTYIIRAWKDNASDTATVAAGAGGASTVLLPYYRITVA